MCAVRKQRKECWGSDHFLLYFIYLFIFIQDTLPALGGLTFGVVSTLAVRLIRKYLHSPDCDSEVEINHSNR